MRKILIVDDEKIMLMLARRMLSSKYEIVLAKSGAEAVELFEKERPDLVLSDLLMPEMDGYELHRILQEKSSEPVPIIFMTADDNPASESKGFDVGAADYIHKPLKADVLLRRVGNILDNVDKLHGLKTAASTDPMTGLLNKSVSQEKISQLLEKSKGALLMLDLDGFKLVNDIYGHGAGDKILICFAELIKKIVGENDLAGRMGGDEFIIYFPNVLDEKFVYEKTVYLNEQLLNSAKKILGEDMKIPLGVSVGAVFSTIEGGDFSALYKKADTALYTVKQNSKHGCSIYGVKSHDENSTAEGISQTIKILSERNVEDGAYFTDFENFKVIFQLLTRMENHYKSGLQLMQFTLSDKKFADKFKSVLINSLRRIDCVTQSGEVTFIVLMPDATSEDYESVKNRVMENCDVEINVESEKIF